MFILYPGALTKVKQIFPQYQNSYNIHNKRNEKNPKHIKITISPVNDPSQPAYSFPMYFSWTVVSKGIYFRQYYNCSKNVASGINKSQQIFRAIFICLFFFAYHYSMILVSAIFWTPPGILRPVLIKLGNQFLWILPLSPPPGMLRPVSINRNKYFG